MTSIFELANRDLAAIFPGGPVPFAYRHRTEFIEEALELAFQYGVESEVLLLICNGETALTYHRSHRPRRPSFIALLL